MCTQTGYIEACQFAVDRQQLAQSYLAYLWAILPPENIGNNFQPQVPGDVISNTIVEEASMDMEVYVKFGDSM